MTSGEACLSLTLALLPFSLPRSCPAASSRARQALSARPHPLSASSTARPPSSSYPAFMPALRLSALGLAIGLLSSAAAALTTCTPSLPAPSAGADGLINVFAMSRGASRACPTSSGAQSADALSPSCLDAAVASWEHVPPSPSWPKSGGALYLVRSSPPTLCGSLSLERQADPAHLADAERHRHARRRRILHRRAGVARPGARRPGVDAQVRLDPLELSRPLSHAHAAGSRADDLHSTTQQPR